MVLVYDNALVSSCSTEVFFFKLEVDEETEKRSWKHYHTISARGQIYYIKGNIRIQITTNDKIYFYLVDKTTLEPTLENVMKNYMQCDQMMFGSKVKYGITYKVN